MLGLYQVFIITNHNIMLYLYSIVWYKDYSRCIGIVRIISSLHYNESQNNIVWYGIRIIVGV